MRYSVLFVSAIMLLPSCQTKTISSGNTTAELYGTGPMSVFYTSAEQWLLSRHKLCQLPVSEQRAHLQVLSAQQQQLTKNNKITRLLLSTCNPELTPGLLSEALHSISEDDTWSVTELYLIEIIRAFNQSYSILDANNQKLEQDLETTINGIREIETEIDNLHQPGDSLE